MQPKGKNGIKFEICLIQQKKYFSAIMCTSGFPSLLQSAGDQCSEKFLRYVWCKYVPNEGQADGNKDVHDR
jgi:hypothetical protein